MGEWEEAPSTVKVRDSNIKQYADLKDGYATGSTGFPPIRSEERIKQEIAQLEGKGGWEEAPGGWEAAPGNSTGPAVPFNSGSAFKDTKDLIPSMDDVKNAWETLKKQWENRHNTPMTPEVARRMMQDEHAVGSAVWDTIGAVPAMLAGGAHGIYEGVRSRDATKGLKTGGETMNKLLPSSLLGNEEDQKREGYKAGMAPLTAVMDTLNAAPQGYGEMLNAAGFPNAAAQVTDAGKLGIMAAFGAKGSHDIYRGFQGNRAIVDSADKLNKLADAVPEPTIKPAEAPDMGTMAHADDFGVINPYDVGGHVSRSDQGHPTTIDSRQGDLFGGENLNEPAPSRPIEQVRQDSLLNDQHRGNEIPYQLSLVDRGAERGIPDRAAPLEMPVVSDRLSLWEEPKAPEAPAPVPKEPIVDISEARAREQAAMDAVEKQAHEEKQAQIEAAYQELENRKQHDFGQIEGEAQLQLARDTDAGKPYPQAVKDAKEMATRMKADIEARYKAGKDFVDNAAMELAMHKAAHEAAFKAREAAEKAQREHELDQMQRQLEAQRVAQRELDTANSHGEVDYQHEVASGNKSLMTPEHTSTLKALLRSGDLKGALKHIAENHANPMYRALAKYLADKVEGILVKVHEESLIHGERDVSGYFDPNSNTMGFSRAGSINPHTILHETVHALTSHLLQGLGNHLTTLAIKDAFNKVSKLPGLAREFPAITNIREFIAEANSNPAFQKFLKDIKVDGRSGWRRFVDGVKTLFGMKSPELGNMLEHVLDLSKQAIEASTKETREGVMAQFKEAGVPKGLIDLMADAQRPPEDVGGPQKLIKGIPGLTDPISDFKFFDKPVEEIIEMAKTAPDIKRSAVDKVAEQLQSGGLFQSLKTRNPVVKFTYETVTRAMQEATLNVKTHLTDPHTGLKARMRSLSEKEKGEIWAAEMLYEGKEERTAAQLAEAGFTQKQIDYALQRRALDDAFFHQLNARRAEIGLEPMDRRVAHVAGRFLGDFSHMVTAIVDGKEKVVGRVSGATRWEAKRAADFIKQQHPEWTVGKMEYNKIGKGKNAADRFSGLMEAINFIEKADGDVKALMDSYREFIKSDATKYLNATRHAKQKVQQAGGILGSEGNKPWHDVETNAQEGMKAQLAYYEQGYLWMAMQKAAGEIGKLTSDEAVAKQQPNASQWASQYLDHSLGRKQGWASDAANGLLNTVGEVSGLGHGTILKLNNAVKHLVMQKFMGLMNIPFSVTQLLQPLQVHPAMLRLLHNRGLEFSTSKAQVDATSTYVKSMLHEHGGENFSAFENAMVQYAHDKGVFDVKMSDHTKDINANKWKEGFDRFADANITGPEHLTRGMSFMFYSHLLKDAGVPLKDVFGAAENLTNATMVNYHPIERPMGYAKLGWIGDVASTLTRYKHNQYSQLAFYAREAARTDGIKAYAPLATFLGTSLAFGGVMGFFAFNEANEAYSYLAEHVFKKPDNLINLLLKSDLPSVITHGIFSSIGIDMTSRFSNANLIPDSVGEALMPYGSAVLDMAQATRRWLLDPTSKTKAKQLASSIAPQSLAGVIENTMWTDNKGPDKNLYINHTEGPNFGKGRVMRSDNDMAVRAFGFRNIGESKELAQNYANSQISQSHKAIADRIYEDATHAAMDGTLNGDKLSKFAREAASHGDIALINRLVTWTRDHNVDQRTQQLLQNAQNGYKGAFNFRNQR